MPASSRIEEPSAVMNGSRSSRRAVSMRPTSLAATKGGKSCNRALRAVMQDLTPCWSDDRAAGGLGVEPVGHAGDDVGHVAPYWRRPVSSGARYPSRHGHDAVSGDGAGEVVVIERVHLAGLLVVVIGWEPPASRYETWCEGRGRTAHDLTS